MLVFSRPTRGEEERVLGAACELGPSPVEIEAYAVRGLLAERHDAFLVALAPDVDGLLLEVHVGEVEVDRLLAAQPGRVDELEKRTIAQRERLVTRDLRQDGVHLFCFGRVGEPPGASGAEPAVGHACRSECVAE